MQAIDEPIQKISNQAKIDTGYDLFFSLNPVPMLIYDTKTLKFLDVNPAAIKMYGYTKDEFLSMSVEDIRPDEDIEKLRKMFKDNNNNTRITGYWRHKRKDGSIFFVEVYSHQIDSGLYKNARVVTAYDVTSKKLAEDNLIKSEQRFRDLAELLPQIIFEIDLSGRLLYCNKIAYDTFQYPYDTDLSTINIFDFVSPSQNHIAQENFSKMVSGGRMMNTEYTLFKKDGSSFTAIVLISPILQNEIPIGFRGTIIDISEMKKVHKELHYSQMKYSSLFENAYSMMMIVDPETQIIIEANKAAADFYGYTLETLKKLHLSDISNRPHEELKSVVKKAMDFEINQFIGQHKLADGSSRFVEVFTSPIVIEGRNFLFSVIHDINERVLAERNIKKLNKAIEQSPVSVVITDRAGNIEYVNPKFSEVTGYTSEEVLGKNPKILKSDEHSDEYYKDLWRTITGGKNWYGEFKNKRKDGSYYWESASISPLFDEQGNVNHFVAIKEDITERKIKEVELRQAKEMAEESNRLKSSFLANMSHELRTPLVGILGYADILANELQENDFKEMADTILQSGQQLVETLNSILDLSRIESNQNHLDIKTCELKSILQETCSLFQSVAKNKNLYIKLNVPDDNIYVDSDNHLLNKIFNNLLNNALKFTSSGGVTISVELEKNNQLAKIDIADTGIGIPEKYYEQIFEPFRQASEGLSRNFGGTGLGLTLTKKFVELINGTLSLSSKVGQGSTFTIKLPLSQQTQQKVFEDEIHINEDSLNLNFKPSMLLVEDDEINAQIVCAYLKPYFNIDHVLDGQRGIEYCKTKDYDVILMDIALKGISGTEAMLEIKKLGRNNSKIPIIAITAFAMLGDRESFLKAGFSHYISKPFTRVKLFEILRQIFVDKSD
ncbi:MAG: PAS domain S-box protein [bacterium]|nr:PAS domain S-box protein [bacterium]